jgi:protein-S-isoprenylcysteine O-methyltransferase Ste14
MIAWINVSVLISSVVLFAHFYIKSAGPAALEKKIGEKAYSVCTQYRVVASIFLGIAVLNYVLSYFYPLPLPIPRTFPWSWWGSALVALVIALLGGYIWFKGMKDAGEETMLVKKEHTLYKGIYTKIRHPQAAGEVTYWWVIAFLLNSPFLVLFSFVWIPTFYVMCLAEENDLIIRYGEKYLEYRKNTGFIIPKRSE